MSEEEYASEPEQQVSLASVLSRYKSTKGAADKRKETSKANMAKARAAKLEALRRKKEEEENEFGLDDESDDDSEEDSEEEEELVIKKAKRQPRKAASQVQFQENDRLRQIEEAILVLAQKANKSKAKPKKKPVRKTTVIQVGVPQKAAPAATPKVAGMVKDILDF